MTLLRKLINALGRALTYSAHARYRVFLNQQKDKL
jgi:hypothetical protein